MLCCIPGDLLLATFLGLASSGGSLLPQLTVPFLLASRVWGYLGGTSLPTEIRANFHLAILIAAGANIGALLQGWVTGIGYDELLRADLTKVGPAAESSGSISISLALYSCSPVLSNVQTCGNVMAAVMLSQV